MQTTLRQATEADWAAVCALEAASYPADEAATPEKLRFRIRNAAHLFRVLEARAAPGADPAPELLGFVCATATAQKRVTEESMFTHEPAGRTAVIHSVVVAEKWRRRGLARHAVTLFARQLAESQTHITTLLLLTHEENSGLYASCGFEPAGVSAVHHGSRPWLEMRLLLDSVVAGPRCWHVNAFSFASPCERHLSGNPACVVVLRATGLSADDASLFPASDAMAAFAAEMRQPATVFIAPLAEGVFAVRYFTVSGEIPLCGHASLAAAHTLWASGQLPAAAVQDTLSLHTRAGLIVQLRCVEQPGGAAVGSSGRYSIRLNAAPHAPLPDLAWRGAPVPVALARALQLEEGQLQPLGTNADGSRSGLLFVGSNGPNDVLVALSPDVFAAAKPDATALLSDVFKGARIVSLSTTGRWSSANADAAATHGSAAALKSVHLRHPDASALPPATGYGSVAETGSPAAGDACGRWWDSADIVSRCFNADGEDPVCGAAHAGIIPFWHAATAGAAAADAGAGSAPAAAFVVRAFQSSPRGGVLESSYDAGAGTVTLTGEATTFLTGAVAAGGLALLGLS
jgi:predicted PhzF superfamily epimerase YddE/YHI9/ribosomal protein S18 acetylase RimI-like enzyme